MDVSELKPNPKNPRTVTPAKLTMLAKALAEFGDLSGIVFNRKSKQLVGGHQRSKLLTDKSKITITKSYDKATATGTVAEGYIKFNGERLIYREVSWGPAKEKAANIAANKGAGEWDFTQLGEWMKDLEVGGFDLDFTLFDEKERLELFGEAPTAPAKAEHKFSAAETSAINGQWRDWCDEVLKGVAALKALRIVNVGMSRAATRIYFLLSLYTKREFPRFGTLPYHPHRLAIAGDKFSIYDLFVEIAEKNPAKAERLRWALAEEPRWDKLIKGSMPLAGARQPLDFPADLAKALIDEFTPASGAVLDPCHGWGGRLIGFLLADNGGDYTGFDPAPETFSGVKEMAADLLPFVMGKKVKTVQGCFEDQKLKPEAYDFALTSPPYFDVEKYSGKDSSHAKFKNFEKWNEGFYRQLVENVFGALKPGAHFALQVGNQSYPLEREAKLHAKRIGFQYVETRTTAMINNQAKTDENEGEVIVLFRKPKAAKQLKDKYAENR